MGVLVSLVGAFLGAGCGAYFAFVKFRRERLWQDRYEALRDVVMSLETIQTHFEVAHLASFGASAMSKKESDRLESEFPSANHDLRRSFAKLRLLFKEDQIAKLVSHQVALATAFFDLYNSESSGNPTNLEAIGEQAAVAISEAIAVAQKHCL